MQPYGCLDKAVDGAGSKRHPQSQKEGHVKISYWRLYCYVKKAQKTVAKSQLDGLQPTADEHAGQELRV